MSMKELMKKEKSHEITFFVINAVIMLTLLIQNWSWFTVVAFLICECCMYFFLTRDRLLKGKATVDLSFIVCVDLWMLCFFKGSYLLNNLDSLKTIFFYLLKNKILYIVSFAILVAFWDAIVDMRKHKEFVTWLGYEIIITIFMIIKTYVMDDKYPQIGHINFMIGIFFTAISIVWFIIANISRGYAENDNLTKKQSMTLFSIFFIIYELEIEKFMSYMYNLPENVQLFAEKYLSWKYVIVILLLMIVGGWILQINDEKEETTTDTVILWAFAGFIFLSKMACEFYFTYNWIVLLIYLFIVCWIVSIEKENNYFWYPGIPFIVGWMSAIMIAINMGVWSIAISVIAVVFLLTALEEIGDTFYYMMIAVAGIAAIVLTWMIHMRFCMENMIVVAIMLAFAELAILFMGWPHPAEKQFLVDSRKGILCVIIIIFMVIPCFKYGSKIEVSQDTGSATVDISIEARGKENEIQECYYYWVNEKGQKISENIQFEMNENDLYSLEMKAECLSIVVIDKYGIKTTRKVWYPYSFQNMDNE